MRNLFPINIYFYFYLNSGLRNKVCLWWIVCYVEICSLFPDVSQTFMTKSCWILLKTCSTYNETITCVFFFSLCIWWITLTDFHMLNHSSSPRWILLGHGRRIFDVLMDSVYQFFIEYFSFSVHKGASSGVFLLCCMFVLLLY